MVKLSHGPETSGTSSSLGIMRVFDVDTGAPKLSPVFVVGLAVAVILLVLLLKNFNVF